MRNRINPKDEYPKDEVEICGEVKKTYTDESTGQPYFLISSDQYPRETIPIPISQGIQDKYLEILRGMIPQKVYLGKLKKRIVVSGKLEIKVEKVKKGVNIEDGC